MTRHSGGMARKFRLSILCSNSKTNKESCEAFPEVTETAEGCNAWFMLPCGHHTIDFDAIVDLSKFCVWAERMRCSSPK